MESQQTLAGETADGGRERPDTMLWCPECDDHVLRSHAPDHRHDVPSTPGAATGAFFFTLNDRDDGGEDENDEPERAGGLYDIELSYSVDFHFRVPAWNEHQAKDRAEDLVQYPVNCANMYQVHSTDREVREILDDDPMLPDDFDVYGSDELWEIWGDGERADEEGR